MTPANIVYRQPWPGQVQALSTSEEPIRLSSSADGHGVSFFVEQQYEILEAAEELGPAYGPWKVSIRAYRYRIDDAANEELVSWHWHPLGRSRYTAPHLHVSSSDLAGLHLSTGRVSLEAVIRLLVSEMGIRSLRPDWPTVLDEAEDAFRRYRTWA